MTNSTDNLQREAEEEEGNSSDNSPLINRLARPAAIKAKSKVVGPPKKKFKSSRLIIKETTNEEEIETNPVSTPKKSFRLDKGKKPASSVKTLDRLPKSMKCHVVGTEVAVDIEFLEKFEISGEAIKYFKDVGL